MTWWELGALGLVGVAAGWINVIAGGGSLLTVPMMLFFGMPGPVANGTNRIGVITQNIAAVGAFRARGFADFRLSATLSAASIPGAVLGAQLGVGLEGKTFERLVALVMVGVLVAMASGFDKTKPRAPGEAPASAKRLVLGHILIALVGFWGGFIQIGVGFLLMPVLHRVMGLDLIRVNMHKVAITLVFTAVAFAMFAAQVEIAWLAGLALAIGNGVGGWLGVHTTIAKGEVWIRRIFYLAIAGMILQLLFG
jgi:uncharacterized membrane protein YfcA